MKLIKINKDMFVSSITKNTLDKFAKTFVSKCDMINGWENCFGCVKNKDIMGAIVVTYTKKEPKCANLQLLHTFAKHRNKGVASFLCKKAFKKAVDDDCKYFRVSSEIDAVEFYRKIGFKFIGKQKSGTLLSIFKINGYEIKNGIYEGDSYVLRKSKKKGKGGVVEFFKEIK